MYDAVVRGAELDGQGFGGYFVIVPGGWRSVVVSDWGVAVSSSRTLAAGPAVISAGAGARSNGGREPRIASAVGDLQNL